MKSKYLIRMLEPEDWIRHYDEGTQVVNDFILPYGKWGKEISDTVYHINAEVPYHEHRSGYETFFLPRGRVECVVRGKKFIMEPGDILHLMPYVAHGFKHLEEGSVWRELFQEIYMAEGISKKNWVNNNYKEKLDDPVFLAHYRGSSDSIPREPAVAQEEVDRTQMREVRTPDFAFSTFRFEGITMNLKVGRWECNGVKEVWQYVMDKGFYVDWAEPYRYFQTLYIHKGKVKFHIEDEVFEAGEDCLVHIPPFHKHSFEVLEDGTEMFDMNCETLMLSMLEDLHSVKTRTPEKLEDKEFVGAFLKKYDCYVTETGKK